MAGPRSRWGGRLALSALVLGCGGDPDPGGSLVVTKPDDETTELRATWPYASFEVDVKLVLITLITPEGCTSHGTLTVDEALSAVTHYSLAATDCSELELTEAGDIIIKGEPTGHDWIPESLSVDTDNEVILLGPAAGTNVDGEPTTYLFALSAPPCPDQPSCDCGLLRRVDGMMNLDLSLGRRC